MLDPISAALLFNGGCVVGVVGIWKVWIGMVGGDLVDDVALLLGSSFRLAGALVTHRYDLQRAEIGCVSQVARRVA